MRIYSVIYDIASDFNEHFSGQVCWDSFVKLYNRRWLVIFVLDFVQIKYV